jgi:hypothetical protein
MFEGSWRFATVSALGFAVWAFGGRWFEHHGGETLLYLACAVVFVGASGLLMCPLVQGSKRLARFYKIFVPAFTAYAIAWCAAWFLFRFGAGEWVASFAGSAALCLVMGIALGNMRPVVKVIFVVFPLHSAGYFFGGHFFYWLNAAARTQRSIELSLIAKLGWGVIYGLGFGAALGCAFFTFQAGSRRDSKSEDG